MLEDWGFSATALAQSWDELAGSATGGGVSNNTGASYEPSLALDSNGNPHIAWYDNSGTDNEIYYAYWNGSGWATRGGGNSGGGVSFNTSDSNRPSLALDSNGYPHIAWHDDSGIGSNNDIYYAYWDGTQWTTHGGADTGGGLSNNTGHSDHPSLALDSLGRPHIAWVDDSEPSTTDFEIYYAYWDGSEWVTHGGASGGGGVSNNTGPSFEPSLALDSSGYPHIAWEDTSGGNSEIYYAYWDGSNWATRGGTNTGGGVSNNTGASYEPSLALDSSGNPHIAWHDNSGGNSSLYYAYWDGSNWATYGGANGGSGITNTSFAGYPSLAVDSNGNPHIAWHYHYSITYEIHYTYWNGSGWMTRDGLSNTSSDTLWPSLALDNCGNPHIAWTYSTGYWSDIYYRYWNTGECIHAENCTNGIDDDGDGLVDCNDPDCNGDPSCDCDITPPVADFSCDLNSGDAPLTVNFTNNSSGDDLCIWDFGDGTTIAVGCEDQEHTFTQEGSYDVTLTVAGVGGIDTAECTIEVTPSEEQTLLEKYAPILYMHPDERFHPTDVKVMLKHSKLMEKRVVGRDRQVKLQETDLDKLWDKLINNYNEEKYYLKLIGEAKKKLKHKTYWKKEQTVYGREIELSSNVRVLQYWFFYVYNDWGGLKKGGNVHEGDWEMIQIILINNQPDQITYSMHHGGLPLEWDDPEVRKHDEHPLVYVTLGGHGSWNEPGDHMWYQDYCVNCIDETKEGGNVLAPENMSIPSDYEYELINLDEEELDWIHWKGYWGTQVWYKDIKDIGKSGPPSPPYIDYIDDDGIDGRWEDPISWGYGPNPPGYIICASENSKIIVHDMEGNVERLLIHCIPVPTCGLCPNIKMVYSEKDLVFDVYSLDGKEVDLKISRYKKSKEVYEVEYKGLDITRKGKASLTFSPEQNPNFEIRIDKDPEGYYESYRMPDYLEVKEVDDG